MDWKAVDMTPEESDLVTEARRTAERKAGPGTRFTNKEFLLLMASDILARWRR